MLFEKCFLFFFCSILSTVRQCCARCHGGSEVRVFQSGLCLSVTLDIVDLADSVFDGVWSTGSKSLYAVLYCLS